MKYSVKSRLWIEAENRMFLGEGRCKLLKAIHQTGSLSKAAVALNMSYKKAWNLLDSINKAAPKQVTVNSTGGKGGGGTELTEYGLRLIDSFEKLNAACWDFLDSELQKLDLE